MRITGWVLFIVGTLLCISIVWATIGFLMMGFGLICLLIAEDRRKRAISVTQPPATSAEPHFQEPQHRPNLASPRQKASTVSGANVMVSAVDQVRQDSSSYDVEKWNSLVIGDPDIARLVEALAPYGRQYVDELAAAYMALNDKSYLPFIVAEVVASARRNAGLKRARDAKVNASHVDTIRSEAPELRSSRSHDLQGAAGFSREPVAVDHVMADPDIRQEPIETGTDRNNAPTAVAVTAASELEPERSATETIGTVTPRAAPAGTEAIRKSDLDDTEDLRDLFKALRA